MKLNYYKLKKFNKFMMQLNNITLISIFIIFLFSCNSNSDKGFKSISAHAQLKIISFTSKSNQLNDGDLIEFKCLHLKNNKDTLSPDSLQLNELYNDTIVYVEKSNSDLMEIFKYLQEGDSCVVLFNKDASLEGILNLEANEISKSDTIYTYLKIKHIYKGREKEAYLLEQNAIARYITFSHLNWNASEQGIYYRIIRASEQPSLVYGDAIKIVYKGYFLNNQIFDNYADINPFFEHKVGTQNQLIRGMEIALKYLSYGSEAEFIFPSSLAFGNKGSSTGIVPAYKPVLYKVKILDKDNL